MSCALLRKAVVPEALDADGARRRWSAIRVVVEGVPEVYSVARLQMLRHCVLSLEELRDETADKRSRYHVVDDSSSWVFGGKCRPTQHLHGPLVWLEKSSSLRGL